MTIYKEKGEKLPYIRGRKQLTDTQHMKYFQLIFYTIFIIFYVLTDLSVIVSSTSGDPSFSRSPQGYDTISDHLEV